jgi:hypothetical protein
MCANKDPPGFLAVIYYDTGTGRFKLYTRASVDFHASTLFKVYTTKGYLQLVNPNAGVYSDMASYTSQQLIDNYHTQTLHVTNTTSTFSDYMGWMDCETQTIGTKGNLACLNKNDYVMLLSGLYAADAVYPNMYQITKLNRAEKDFRNDVRNGFVLNSDKIRSTISLDMSVNQRFSYKGGSTNALDTTALVYKFYPDTSKTQGGYAYAGECSHRGVCNSGNGLCECFGGYTNDNCNMINALAL